MLDNVGVHDQVPLHEVGQEIIPLPFLVQTSYHNRQQAP